MDSEQTRMKEVVCDLALEIIFLMTGENHAIVKMASIESLLRGVYPRMLGGSLSQAPIAKPPSHFQAPESNNQKILDVTKKIMELVAGEDHFQDPTMKDPVTPTSSDGSKKGNPLKRRFHPLLPQGPTQEISHHVVIGNEIRIIDIKEEPEEMYISGVEYSNEQGGSPEDPDESLEHTKQEEEEGQISPHNSAGWGHVRDIQKRHPEKVSNGGIQSDATTSTSLDKDFNTLKLPSDMKDETMTWSHICIHTGEKPYSCSECGKCFTTKASLTEHEHAHTGEKPYSCPDCGKCYSHKFNLISHKRVHREKRPYSCSVCGRSFYQKSHLIGHERVHTGEKPFSCAVCGKCFSDRTVLVRHERVHTGEKPYSCSECGRCFSQKANLMRHEQTHVAKNQQESTTSACS